MQKIIYITSPNSQEIHVWKIDKYSLLKSIQTLNTIEQVQPDDYPSQQKKFICWNAIHS